MSIAEMNQAVQDLMSNKADNLNNDQRGMFMEIRQALILLDYLRGLEAVNK
jgi:hypothetical protein